MRERSSGRSRAPDPATPAPAPRMPPGTVGDQVLDALRSAGHDEAARDLETWLLKLSAARNAAERKRPMKEVVSRCGTRWLGDLWVPSVGAGWWTLLGRLASAAQTSAPDEVPAVSRIKPAFAAPKPVPVPSPRRKRPRALPSGARGRPAGDLVRRLDSWLAAHRPEYLRKLLPGLGVREMRTFESEIGHELPRAMRDLYAWRNGQADIDALLHSFSWMYANDVEREHDLMVDLAESERDVDWSDGWIPFLTDGGGDFVCVDLDGTCGGAPGQVLEFRHDDTEQTITHRSFHAWLATFVGSLEAGLWKPGREGVLRLVRASALEAFHRERNPGYPRVVALRQERKRRSRRPR